MSEQFNPQELLDGVKAVQATLDKQKSDFEAFKEANDLRIEEKAKGIVDPILEEKMKRIDGEITKAQERLDQFELAQKRKSMKVIDENGNEVDLEAKAQTWASAVARQAGTKADDFGAEKLAEYKTAFHKLIRHKMDPTNLSELERKALSVGTDTAGGYFVHPDMTGRIVAQVYETSPVRAYAAVQVIGTDALEGYYDNNQVGFGWVEELESRSETTTPDVGKWRIPVHEMYAMPKASQKILDDAEMDMEAWLSAKIADRFARAENAAFVTGTGVGQPRGFMTYADGTDLTNSVEQVATGVSGDFAAAPNGFDTLLTALYKLKAQYRANAVWFMNRTTAGALRKEKDSNGAMLWQPAAAAGQPATVLGYPTASFEDMADIAANSLSIAVGDLRAAYQVVDRFGVRMLRDPFSSKPNVLFYATKRTGGDMINGEALKIIKFGS